MKNTPVFTSYPTEDDQNVPKRSRIAEVLVTIFATISIAFLTRDVWCNQVRQPEPQDTVLLSSAAFQEMNENIASLLRFQDNMNNLLRPQIWHNLDEYLLNVSILEDRISNCESQSKKLTKVIEQLNDEISDIKNERINLVAAQRPMEETGMESHENVNQVESMSNDVVTPLKSQNMSFNSLSYTSTNALDVSNIDTLHIGSMIDRNLQQVKGDICSNLPFLSPINRSNNFTYDEKIDHLLVIMHALSPPELFVDPKTPQYNAACWMLYDGDLQALPEGKAFLQIYAVAVLFFALGIENSNLKANFAFPEVVCARLEFECNKNYEITEIKLGGKNLKGSIPDEISILRQLKVLQLNENELTGTIPPSLDVLKQLEELELANNRLDGTIPAELCDMRNLRVFNAQMNNLTGSIPTEVGKLKNLTELSLEQNEIEGQLPKELFDSMKLSKILLGFNYINGTIPTVIGKSHNLVQLKLNQNSMIGTIPSEFGHLKQLKDLWLNRNQFTGTIPAEVENMSSLMEFGIAENFLNGRVPDIFHNLHNLTRILLNDNRLDGEIPSSLWELQNIHHVELSNNNLTGSVTKEFCNRVDQEMISVDDSPWFNINPKVKCECCSKTSCYITESTQVTIGDTVFPSCPEGNMHEFIATNEYTAHDVVANMTKNSVFVATETKKLCLSPTGCYKIEYTTDLDGGIESYDLSYSASNKSWWKQDTCDDVLICGNKITKDGAKRKGLNRLTQLAVSDLSLLEDDETAVSKAMCFVMKHNETFFDDEICDGTLLQRFIMALFLYSYKPEFEFDIDNFHECDLPNIKCDPQGIYVEEILYSDQNMTGTLISELGLLPRLKTMQFRNNYLSGTLDPFMFLDLSDLETFDISNNNFQGELPKQLLKSSSLKCLNLAKNSFAGSIPDNLTYPEHLENFSASENIFNGPIPLDLFSCKKLKNVDLKRNGLTGSIPSTVENLLNLEEFAVGENLITGSIPIFKSTGLKKLLLYSNKLTGSIPAELGNLISLNTLRLNHNSLKGTVPEQLNNLERMKYFHLHQNNFFGKAPDMKKSNHLTSYISDCGVKSRIECDSCDTCCLKDDAEQKCQKNIVYHFPLWAIVMMSTLLCSTTISIILFVFIRVIKRPDIFPFCIDDRDPSTIYKQDSVYCFGFSSSRRARATYATIATIQAIMFVAFLQASDGKNENSDWEFTIRCLSDSLMCEDEKSTSAGWYYLTFLIAMYLGSDIIDSILQIRKAIALWDFDLFCNGILLNLLTLFATTTSITYNKALAETSTQMIVNAVILLFINDLDEQCMYILLRLAPKWTGTQRENAAAIMAKKMPIFSLDFANDNDCVQADDSKEFREDISNDELLQEIGIESEKDHSEHLNNDRPGIVLEASRDKRKSSLINILGWF